MQLFEKFLTLIHSDTFNVYWLFYLGYIAVSAFLGYAALRAGRSLIAWLQLAGAAGLVAGIFFPPLTLVPLLWLLPLALANIRKAAPYLRYNLLYACIAPVLLVVLNRTYGFI